MVVSWEGGSPRKRAGVAPVECLQGHCAVVTFRSRQLGYGVGKLVGTPAFAEASLLWRVFWEPMALLPPSVVFPVPAAGEGRGAVCCPLVWEGRGTGFKPRFSLCLDVSSGPAPVQPQAPGLTGGTAVCLTFVIRKPPDGCVAGHCPRCSVGVVIMHIPEHGTPSPCPGCLLVLFSGI